MNDGKIAGVSLGPGEPELITVKALKFLQTADVIFCPATPKKDGTCLSRAMDILRALAIDTGKIHCFVVPMSLDRTAVLKRYDEVCEEVMQWAGMGKTVAITAEGDACFYSSASYMFDRICQKGFPVEIIAGVPAFIAAGASVGLHIVKQQERLLVIPGDVRKEELEEALRNHWTVVIMKLPRGEKIIRAYVGEHPEFQYCYFEQVGTETEFFTSDCTVFLHRPLTYFSILVIRNTQNN